MNSNEEYNSFAEYNAFLGMKTAFKFYKPVENQQEYSKNIQPMI
jgi:hypothetical protein